MVRVQGMQRIELGLNVASLPRQILEVPTQETQSLSIHVNV
jgi:hypothetical protein